MSLNNYTPYGDALNKIMALSPFQVDWSRISVSMSTRLRTTGGQAKWIRATDRSEITLNAAMFAKLNEAERYEILSHEMAHAILQIQHIFDKHGYRWQNLHRRLGGTAKQCHNHEVQVNLRRRVVIRCQKKNICVLVTLQRWNKLKDAINHGRIPYDFIGVIACDLNARTYRWETLRFPELREVPVVKNLKLAA